ncbi:MAG TPA: hypothetical protein VHM89_13645 [Acidimicrobiales bacterium]|nr:hypothetical protein [Acidimicrobiales bacterium]
MPDPRSALRRHATRWRAGLGAVAATLWSALVYAPPAAAHTAVGDSGAEGWTPDWRAFALGLAMVAVACLAGRLVAGGAPAGPWRDGAGRGAAVGAAAMASGAQLNRVALVVAVAAAAAVAAAPAVSRWRPLIAVVLLAVVEAGGSGAVAVADRGRGVVHVVAAALWIGALVEVAAAWRRGAAAGRRAARRVAAPAAALLAVMVATGAVAATEHLGDAQLAAGTWWGRMLALKVTLVAMAAALGALVRRRWVPRLEATVLAGAACIGLVLAALGGPLSGDPPAGPLFLARNGAAVVVTPLAPGPNTVLVRHGGDDVVVEVDGRVVAVTAGPGGLSRAPVDLAAGRHTVRALGITTDVIVRSSDAATVLRAELPADGGEPGCLDRLAGAAAGAAALSGAGVPVRLEVSLGGGHCRLPGQEPWAGRASETVTASLDALAARGADGLPAIVVDGDPRAGTLVAAVTALRPGATIAEAGSLPVAGATGPVIVATSPRGARAAVAAAVTATRGVAPVVLAPWLLDAGLIAGLADDRIGVLVAATRDPTSAGAVEYRRATAGQEGGFPATADGWEGYETAVTAATGRIFPPPSPGLFGLSRVAVLPPSFGQGHTSTAGWAPGVAMVRVG